MDGWVVVSVGAEIPETGREGLGLRGRGPPRAHSEPGSHSLAAKPAPEAPRLTGKKCSVIIDLGVLFFMELTRFFFF